MIFPHSLSLKHNRDLKSNLSPLVSSFHSTTLLYASNPSPSSSLPRSGATDVQISQTLSSSVGFFTPTTSLPPSSITSLSSPPTTSFSPSPSPLQTSNLLVLNPPLSTSVLSSSTTSSSSSTSISSSSILPSPFSPPSPTSSFSSSSESVPPSTPTPFSSLPSSSHFYTRSKPTSQVSTASSSIPTYIPSSCTLSNTSNSPNGQGPAPSASSMAWSPSTPSTPNPTPPHELVQSVAGGGGFFICFAALMVFIMVIRAKRVLLPEPVCIKNGSFWTMRIGRLVLLLKTRHSVITSDRHTRSADESPRSLKVRPASSWLRSLWRPNRTPANFVREMEPYSQPLDDNVDATPPEDSRWDHMRGRRNRSEVDFASIQAQVSTDSRSTILS